MMPLRILTCAPFVCLLLSCKPDPVEETDPPSDPPVDSSNPDTAVEDDWCTSNGYTVRDFQDGSGSSYGSIAADFTVETLDGPWTFSEHWSGCDNYLFVNYASGYDYADELWESDPRAFLRVSPLNVHYFFMSYDQGQEEGQVTAIQERFLADLAEMTEGDQEHWADRLHFVTDSAWEAGSVGNVLQSRGSWSIGIDRFQRFQEVGYLANPSRNWTADLKGLTYEARYYDQASERTETIAALGSDPYVSFDGSAVSSGYADLVLPDADTMASYDTMHLELNLECGDPFYENCGEWDYLIYAYVCDDPVVDNTNADTECQPAVAEALGLCTEEGEASKDTCREDADCTSKDKDGNSIERDCIGYEPAVDPDTLTCSCDDPDGSVNDATQTCSDDGAGYDDCACACNTEIGRWITSYARSGHWLLDASPALAFFKDGGNHRLRFSSSYSYGNTLTFHMSNQGKGSTPRDIQYLFSGGGFNEYYNDAYTPLEIDIPADAKRVELYAVISGHGWGAEVENCAEFCNHTHHFSVNGTEYAKEHPEADNSSGCIDQIDVGTVPNQFGTWPYGRGGWCPGKQVDPWIVDITDSITPGETATISYQALFQGDAPYVPQASNSGQGFAANINMRSYLVVSY